VPLQKIRSAPPTFEEEKKKEEAAPEKEASPPKEEVVVKIPEVPPKIQTTELKQISEKTPDDCSPAS